MLYTIIYLFTTLLEVYNVSTNSITLLDVYNVSTNSITRLLSTCVTSSPAGLFSLFQSLVSGKTLDAASIAPVLEKFRDLLIGKNVASEIATKLCSSVESKLVGKVGAGFVAAFRASLLAR